MNLAKREYENQVTEDIIVALIYANQVWVEQNIFSISA